VISDAPTPQQTLLLALETTARALEEGDAEGAAAAMGLAATVCQALGGGLEDEALVQAQALMSRCRSSGDELRQRLQAQLAELGTSQRATRAYAR
jgi:hypothetical protein